MVFIIVKWNKDVFENVEISKSETITSFKNLLHRLTHVPAERQKLMAKGLWSGFLKDDADFSKFSFKDGQVVVLLGTAEVFVEEAPKVAKQKLDIPIVAPNGIQNIGNSSYINAVIQSLASSILKSIVISSETSNILNKAGFPMTQSKHNGVFYCGRMVGRANLPGSNGQCGPNDGPNCSDCSSITPYSETSTVATSRSWNEDSNSLLGNNISRSISNTSELMYVESRISSSVSESSSSDTNLLTIVDNSLFTEFASLLSKLGGPSNRSGLDPSTFVSLLRDKFTQFSKCYPGKNAYKECDACQFLLDFVADFPLSGKCCKSLFNIGFVELIDRSENRPEVLRHISHNVLNCLIYDKANPNVPIDSIHEGIKLWMSETASSPDPSVVKEYDYSPLGRTPNSYIKLASLPAFICIRIMRYFTRDDGSSANASRVGGGSVEQVRVNATSGGSVLPETKILKLMAPVSFEEELDVFDFCCDELKATLKSARDTSFSSTFSSSSLNHNSKGIYELQSVIAHGGTFDYGHYSCIARDRRIDSWNQWWRLDDACVSSVAVSDVLNLKGGINSDVAYMLFYQLKN